MRNIEFHGWKRIKSEAHAAHLLRRELKHHAQWQQRNKDMTWDYRQLLRINKGNWYKFMKNRTNRYCSILIWERKE